MGLVSKRVAPPVSPAFQRAKLWALAWLSLSACFGYPTEEPLPLSAPRILGALVDPPEVAPGEALQVTLIAGGPAGILDVGPARFRFCETPRALSESGFVSARCLEGEGAVLERPGLSLSTTLPQDACARFGSRSETDLRPRDSDGTGGFYQPLRVSIPGAEPAVVRIRMLCPLSEAPIDAIRRYTAEYERNRVPGITGLSVRRSARAHAGMELDEDVPPDTELELEVQVSPEARERYLLFDRGTGALREEDETLRASWFVTAGELESGQTEFDAEGRRSRNVWRSPAESEEAQLWVLVRDDRGALSHLSRRLRSKRPLGGASEDH